MIVVRLMGGLGNQLFQYAAGRALSLRHNTELKFDFSFLNADPQNRYTKRNLEINLFTVTVEEVTEKELNRFKSNSLLRRAKRKFFGNLFSRYHIANHYGVKFDNSFFNYPKNTYLNGYWQSEKYFYSVREILLKELRLKRPKTEEVLRAENEIQVSVSVSLHVRRGDYVSDKSAAVHHGVLSLDYYYKALELIKKQYPSITIFVFSDDTPWVKNNLILSDKCHYIDFNTGENSVFDMYLMSLCKHNIIANSSFSWWGAWLNQNQEKIVVSPKNWFTNKELTDNDIIPDTWVQL